MKDYRIPDAYFQRAFAKFLLSIFKGRDSNQLSKRDPIKRTRWLSGLNLLIGTKFRTFSQICNVMRKYKTLINLTR